MRINEDVENRLREAYSAVVGRDGDRMVRALSEIDRTDGESALRLCLFVVGSIVRDIYGDEPTDKDLHAIADQVVKGESGWVRLDEGTVTELLRMTVGGGPSEASLNSADLPQLAVVCAGHMLAAFSDEGQDWWQYLDEILDDLQDLPNPI